MKNLFIFLLGATAGSLITWKLIEDKYKKIADEEIESVKERFKEREKKEKKSKNEYNTYKDIIKDLSYDNNGENKESENNIKEFSTSVSELVKENIDNVQKENPRLSNIEIITSDEFGDLEGYDSSYWTLYSDNILVDDFNNVITEPKLFLGNALDNFDDEDSIFVRNHDTSTDYEILKVLEKWKEE